MADRFLGAVDDLHFPGACGTHSVTIMRTLMLLTLFSALPVSFQAADAQPKDEITQAIQSLGVQVNYSWISTTKPESNTSLTRQGPTEGKADPNGFTHFRFTLDGNSVEAAFKGLKSAIKTEAVWESSEELSGNRQWIARRLRAFRPPVAEAGDLLKATKALRREKGGEYSGDLTTEGVKEMLLARSRDDTVARVPSGAKGWVKFWVKNGVLVKYEYNLQGKILLTDHQQEFTVNRTTTVEIRDIGSTKVQVPEDARKKLS